jgi:hypothetical protein
VTLNQRVPRPACPFTAKALLFGKHPDAFEEQHDGRSLMTTIEYQHWRAKGPVGKLHNLVVDVCNVHQLLIFFERVQQRDRLQKKLLRLILDTDTRWLSQLYMIRRALLLKTSIRMLLIEAQEAWNKENWSQRMGKVPLSKLAKLLRYLQEENQLKERGWEILQDLERILSAFEVVVKRLEGDGQIRTRRNGQERSYGNIWNIILAFKR